jgi:radical SAM enzyme (TIGR01210 family)
MREPATEFSDDWVLQHRPARNAVDPSRPYALHMERERSAGGPVVDVAVVFLTNKECPLRCLMCDLWKNTLNEAVAPGVISGQIRWALQRLPGARHIKLYNSANFFDPQAIPRADDDEIARLVAPFEAVIVESHPRMIGRRCLAFNDRLGGRLQVAMGLETAHPDVLRKLNKKMTLEDFRRTARRLCAHSIAVRAFVLLRPPFLSESEGVLWARRSIDFAFDAGAECCVIIPTRGGNGALEVLAARGLFEPPALDSLEDVLDYGLSLGRGRVFADLWDIERLAGGSASQEARLQRLARLNLAQVVEPRVEIAAGAADAT